jgi:hypothetical protein
VVVEGASSLQPVEKAELCALNRRTKVFPGGEGLFSGSERSPMVALGESHGCEGGQITALRLCVTRVSELLVAAEQSPRFVELPALEMDLEDAADRAERGPICSSGISAKRASASSQRPSIARA